MQIDADEENDPGPPHPRPFLFDPDRVHQLAQAEGGANVCLSSSPSI